LAGPLCRRLAWAVEGPAPVVFRPLEDGSLSDHRDDAVEVAPAERIRLAHACVLDPEVCSAWARHFLDYEVTPLFAQFTSPAYRLQAAAKDDTEIADFEGHMLKSAQLWGRVQSLGYERGPYEGHMWFQLYRKRFAGLSLEAVIHFSGTRPEEDNPV